MNGVTQGVCRMYRTALSSGTFVMMAVLFICTVQYSSASHMKLVQVRNWIF